MTRVLELKQAFRAAMTDAEKEVICLELDALFATRSDFQRGAGTAYAWGVSKKVIPPRKGAGFRNGIKVPCKVDIAGKAAVRTQLHQHCKKKRIPMIKETEMAARMLELIAGGTLPDIALEQVVESGIVSNRADGFYEIGDRL